MAASASCNCWSKEVIGGDDGGEEGVEMLEKLGEVWWYKENVFRNNVLSQRQSCK